MRVHLDCRRNYTSKRRYELEQKRGSSSDDVSASTSKSLRSSGTAFNWKQDCFFCSAPVVLDDRHPDRNTGSIVQTLEIRDNMLCVCDMRNDQWGLIVSGRLHTCHDLVAEEARYHRTCMQSFCSSKGPPEAAKAAMPQTD